MRARVLATLTTIALLASMAAFTGCRAENVIDSSWPKAVSERAVAKPVGTPRWPLTGLDAPTAEATRIRVVSVKIENSQPARPQSGLDQADVVYETVTEGGITRFNALFQSKSPKTVGPVRSARPSDLYVLPQYHALFAHVGGERDVMKTLKDRKKYDDLDQFFNPAPYWRSHDRPAPHNMYSDIARLRAEGRKKGFAAAKEITGLAFVRASAQVTPSVTLLSVPFAPGNKVSWKWDAKSGTYARSINGKPHTDLVSRKQYRARNVVVMWAQVKGTSSASVIEIIMAGSGRVSVFRDGQRFDGTWEAGLTQPPTLRAGNGQTIKLSPGITWFQVIENSQNIVLK